MTSQLPLLVPSLQALENSINDLKVLSERLNTLLNRVDKLVARIDARLNNIRLKYEISGEQALHFHEPPVIWDKNAKTKKERRRKTNAPFSTLNL